MRLDGKDEPGRADGAGEGVHVLAAARAYVHDDVAGKRLVDVEPIVIGVTQIFLEPRLECKGFRHREPSSSNAAPAACGGRAGADARPRRLGGGAALPRSGAGTLQREGRPGAARSQAP